MEIFPLNTKTIDWIGLPGELRGNIWLFDLVIYCIALQGVLCQLEKWLSLLKQGPRYGLKCALLICMDITYLLPLETFKGWKISLEIWDIFRTENFQGWKFLSHEHLAWVSLAVCFPYITVIIWPSNGNRRNSIRCIHQRRGITGKDPLYVPQII